MHVPDLAFCMASLASAVTSSDVTLLWHVRAIWQCGIISSNQPLLTPWSYPEFDPGSGLVLHTVAEELQDGEGI